MDKGRFEPHIFGMTVLSGKTKPFAVLGHPVGHSLSPAMHNPALQAMGLDAAYLAFDVVPERVLEVLASMEVMGFGGVNLTVPHKEVAFAGFDRLDPSAQVMRAVNTVQFTPDGMVGHPKGLVWFCGRHVGLARELSHLSSEQALSRLRIRRPLSWVRRLLG